MKRLTSIVVTLAVLTGLGFGAVLCYSLVTMVTRSTANTPDTPTQQPSTPAGQTVVASPPQPSTQTARHAAPPNANETWNGLRIRVIGVTRNGWPLIKAANPYNDPPLSGMRMLLLTLRVENEVGPPEDPVRLYDADFKLIDDQNVVYETFRVSCGVVPDVLDGVVPLNGSMDGKICFQVPADTQNFQLIYEPYDFPAVYFDVPDPADLPPTEPAPALAQADRLTPDGALIEVTAVDFSAWPLIKAQNANNKPPIQGRTMLLITVRMSNVAGGSESYLAFDESDFKLMDAADKLYVTYDPNCGVIPNAVGGVAAEGESFEGSVCFQVSPNAGPFRLLYERYDSPAVYIPLPAE